MKATNENESSFNSAKRVSLEGLQLTAEVKRFSKSGVLPASSAATSAYISEQQMALRKLKAESALRTVYKYWHYVPRDKVQLIVARMMTSEPQFDEIENKVAVYSRPANKREALGSDSTVAEQSVLGMDQSPLKKKRTSDEFLQDLDLDSRSLIFSECLNESCVHEFAERCRAAGV